jgi:ApaG protein
MNINDVQVSIKTKFIPEKSSEEQKYFFFAYQITIKNESRQQVQLLKRYWLITNAEGQISEVEGSGVIGQTPTLSPGEIFSYVSACPLDTPMGTMQGFYTMVDQDKQQLKVEIPLFSLRHPKLCH